MKQLPHFSALGACLLAATAQAQALPPSAPSDQTVPTEVEADGASPLVPEGEEELMGEHPVDAADITFVPGRGLRVTSADGRFRLEIRARAQIAWEVRREAIEGWGQEVRLRRARLQLGGHMFSEDTQFKFELAVSPNDLGVRNNLEASDEIPRASPLLDFYVDFRQLRDLQLRVGQYKIPSNRQRVISSGDLQLVDRSIFNSEFSLDRDVGLDLRSTDLLGLDLLRYYAGVYIARGRGARGFDDFGMLYLGRVEVLPLGTFDDYSEADFERTGPRLSIGAGYAYIDRAPRDLGTLGNAPADGGTTDTQHVYADLMFKWAGLSVLGEFGYRHGKRNPGTAVDAMGIPLPVTPARNGLGASIQAGYLIPHLPVEIAGRYSLVRGLGDTSLEDSNELTLGVNYYPGRHPYKLQVDYSRLWVDEFGVGDHRIRVQLQVAL